MSITYAVIRETHTLGECTRESYGIAAYSDVESNGTGCILCAARDLSHERASLDALVERLNRENASEVHFEELVEEYLATR